MRLIRKSSPPQSFKKYEGNFNADFREMDTDVKDELRESLVKEQKGVCAYCQQILKKSIKIEHHCEYSICNGSKNTEDKRLDYFNLFAVCKGFGGINNDQHCDTKKASFNSTNGLPVKFNPLNANHILTIDYSSSGLIRTNNPLFEVEINLILGLNVKYLKDLRKRKWLLFFKYCMGKDGKINIKKLKKLIEVDLAESNNRFKNSFPGLSEFILKKFC